MRSAIVLAVLALGMTLAFGFASLMVRRGGSLFPTPPPSSAVVSTTISAARLSIRIFATNAADTQEQTRLPVLRDSLSGVMPSAWTNATLGRGQLRVLNSGADIDVELSGSDGTSVFTRHGRGAAVTRAITVHTIDRGRRLSLSELTTITLHELGHIWCCYDAGAVDGHWPDPPAGSPPVGIMLSPIRCEATPNRDPICPAVFSDRELATMHLSGP